MWWTLLPFGLVSGLQEKIKYSVEFLLDNFCLELQLNIDGLPLFKSTNHQFWPILGLLKNVNDNKDPFISLQFSLEKASQMISVGIYEHL